MMAHFKPCKIPRRIIMRLARDISILNLVGCLIRVNIHREERLQKNFLFLPVDLIADLQLRAVCFQRNILRNL